MDILRAMRTFVAVEDEGGFAAAGRKLNLSKPVVSKQISSLEEHLGTRLLNRTTRRNSLTEAGRLYLEHARAVLEQVATTEEVLAAQSAKPQGLLRVSAPLAYGRIAIAPLLPPFMAAYPDLRLDLQFADRYVDLVEEGIDVAIRVGGEGQSQLIGRKIDETRHGFFASPSYLEANGRPKTEKDLTQHRCLVSAQGTQIKEWEVGDSTFVPDWIVRCADGDLLRTLALEGAGLIFLPDFFVADDVRDGALVPIKFGKPPQTLAIRALYPHREFLPLKVRVFIDHLTEHFGKKGN